jgi:D-glycero-alpha-D-manno-heptose 1-phosphate guanylyltransferase
VRPFAVPSLTLPSMVPLREATTAIILAGGMASRLRGVVEDVPKPLISCLGRPFIEWVLDTVAQHGICDVIVSTGHLADVSARYFATRARDSLSIGLVRESQPLGTGGAIRFAWLSATDHDVLVLNGDSLLAAEWTAAWDAFAAPEVDAVIVGVMQDDASRFGTLRFDAAHRLISFDEKRPGGGVINAGIYILKQRLLSSIPSTNPLSIEHDLFPGWLAEGRDIRVSVAAGPFIDIGTPDSLSAATGFLSQLSKKDFNL